MRCHLVVLNTFQKFQKKLDFCILFYCFSGTDGPAFFLKPEVQDLDTKLQILSVGSTATEDDAEQDSDRETPVDTIGKPDLQEILQKRGKIWKQDLYEQGFLLGFSPFLNPLICLCCQESFLTSHVLRSFHTQKHLAAFQNTYLAKAY